MLAPAKINLMLHVTGRQENGYHLLQSLVMFADTGDQLSAAPSDRLELEIQGPFATLLSEPEDNLVIRAARALAHDRSSGARITLTKNLPIGAGLGGGSSDAATALMLLNKLWDARLSFDRLEEIAATLGSDVPACLYQQPCWMEGTGHRLSPLAIAFELPILLVNPGIPLATKDVYGALEQSYATPMTLPPAFASIEDMLGFLQSSGNSLETPALRLQPRIADVLKAISALPGCELARMSGSGATCFGLFRSMDAAYKARDELQRAEPEWWVRAATLTRQHGKTQ